MDFKIFLGFNYKDSYQEGFFYAWSGTMATFTTSRENYAGGKKMNGVECLSEFTKLMNHYQPYSDDGTITNWKIEIHYGQNNIVDTDFVKDKIIEEVRSLGAKASFDPRQLTDDEKLAVFYLAQYIKMQEDLNANRSILFRDYVTNNLPDTMKIETDGIVKGIGNISAEILGNDKDTLIPDDEPYIETTNGGI